jgi:hypothetical protein
MSDTTPKEDLEVAKLALECKALRKNNSTTWRFFQWMAMVVPAAAFLVAVITLADTQYRKEDEELLTLLGNVGAKEEHLRLSAISRLSAYQPRSGLLSWMRGDVPIEVRRTQIVESVAAAVRLETNWGVKKAMLGLLEHHGRSSLEPLRRLRIDLIRQLKQEEQSQSTAYWRNLRETLFSVGITLSAVTGSPPDFRCFPLKGIKLRQYELPDNSDFTGATLAEAEFWGGTLRSAIFKDANLYKATIKHVDLTGANFRGASLRGATIGPDVHGIEPDSFRGADWWRATWAPGDARRVELQLQKKATAREINYQAQLENRETYCRELLSSHSRGQP